MTDRPAPLREWWSVAEIAEAGLAAMPATRQGVEAIARRQNWRGDPAMARRRRERGGGWEYSWLLFPAATRHALTAENARVPEIASEVISREAAWAAFEALPEAAKSEARRRLRIIQAVELMEADRPRHVAVRHVAEIEGAGARAIWEWRARIEAVAPEDRLAYLAPRHRMRARPGVTAEIDPAFLDAIKADYLRPAAPTFASSYRRARRLALHHGWAVPDERTTRRRLHADVSKASQILARKGVDALKRLYPPQERDKSALSAMEAVNADFHKFDVFVRWPGEPGSNYGIVARPQMVAFQDIYSGRILSWRIDQTPNAEAVRLAAGDMIETWGIPQHILLDNGREFAAKALTGGAPTRYRFKVREDDVPGLFVSLGCQIHWATPYSGQSKPIERAFRDMCDDIAKDPRFDGAYTGNRPEAKPEDYGSRAIPLDEFLAVLAEGIEAHNTRDGRMSPVAFGRSFVEVFDESYASAPIRKATDAQRRLWLMGAEGLRGDGKTGALSFQGNRFWAAWMHVLAGKRVIARFDPADFFAGLHIYGQDNAYLGHAPCLEKVGFFDMEEARAHSRARATWLAAEKRATEAHRRMSAAELGAALNAVSTPDSVRAEARVVRPVFGRAPASRPPVEQPGASLSDIHRMQEKLVAALAGRQTPAVDHAETARERFRRARDIEAAQEAGRPVTGDQQRWLHHYSETPEYRAERMLWDSLGDAIFG